MRSADLPVPGLLWGDYPERRTASVEPSGPTVPVALKALTDRAEGLLSNARVRLLTAFVAQRRSFRSLGEAQFSDAVRRLPVRGT